MSQMPEHLHITLSHTLSVHWLLEHRIGDLNGKLFYIGPFESSIYDSGLKLVDVGRYQRFPTEIMLGKSTDQCLRPQASRINIACIDML